MIYFIVNKRSGNGQAGKVWAKLQESLRRSGLAYQVFFSSDAEEACARVYEIAETASARALESSSVEPRSIGSNAVTLGSLESKAEVSPRIIVVGGDGTIHGLLPALIKTGLALGIVPAGSGNDLARSLAIPLEPQAALQVAVASSVMELDCIYAYDSYSVTVVGMGLDAQVAEAVNRSKWKKWFNMLHIGGVSYVFSLLHVLLTYRPAQVELLVDGTAYRYEKVWLMASANTPYFGGGMKISPYSAADDGLLDICIVHGLTRFGLLLAFPKVYKGTHLQHPNVVFLRGSHVQATADQPLLAHGDGEVLGKTPANIQIHTKKLKVITARN